MYVSIFKLYLFLVLLLFFTFLHIFLILFCSCLKMNTCSSHYNLYHKLFLFIFRPESVNINLVNEMRLLCLNGLKNGLWKVVPCKNYYTTQVIYCTLMQIFDLILPCLSISSCHPGILIPLLSWLICRLYITIFFLILLDLVQYQRLNYYILLPCWHSVCAFCLISTAIDRVKHIVCCNRELVFISVMCFGK